MKALFQGDFNQVLLEISNVPREKEIVFLWNKHWMVDSVVWRMSDKEQVCDVYLSQNARTSLLDEK